MLYPARVSKERGGFENRLSAEQCNEIGHRIIERFYRLGEGGTQFGCDWPTMWMLHPRMCQVFQRLKRRWKSLQTV